MILRILTLILISLWVTACETQSSISTSNPIQPAQTAELLLTPEVTPVLILSNEQPAITATFSPGFTPAATSEPEVLAPLQHLSAGAHIKINSIQVFPGGSGWALGGEIDLPFRVFFTQDFGATWTDRTPPEPAPLPGSPEKSAVAFFYDPQHAWVTFGPPETDREDQPVVWRTSDGGVSWTASQVLPGASIDTVYSPTTFFFSDIQHGWLMSHHGAAAGHTPVSIYQTLDGGESWFIVARPMDEVSFPLHTCCQRGMIFFDDTLTGIIARDGGPISTPHILRTNDGGITWQQQDLPEFENGFFDTNYCTTSSLQRVSGHSASVVMNCYDLNVNEQHQAFLFITNNRGETWNWQSFPKAVWPSDWVNVRSVAAVQWLDLNTQWLFIQAYYELPPNTNGYNATQIYQTLDAGRSWNSLGYTYWRGDFSFANENDGLAIARSAMETALVYTKSGGLRWSMLDPVLVK